ncbi:hypothetical protein BDZ97DRAFT_1651638 [Flammula alnicola]|nr:hypothetical protein BDZ97DRAFT_1651638 [Flammula alnicola]
MSYDDSDDLAYNPFAEQDYYSSGSNLAQGYYSSAFFPMPSEPVLGRRRSSLTEQTSSKGNEGRRKHNRSRTEIQIVPHSAGLHPLKSALARIDGPVDEDLGITRPHLSRIVNEGTLVDIPSSAQDATFDKNLPLPEEEKEVIVHHVTSKDSLAGVSLKYGISLANLRRANQLWTSDTIHRRDVLYIPIDQASRVREYIPEPTLITFPSDSQDVETSVFDSGATSTSSLDRENSDSVPPSPSVPIRRIPTKQLSYFPPSIHKNVDPGLLTEANSLYLQSTGGSRQNRYTPSPASNSLTSILTALPIAASTRDEIITRLSFDSVSSSFSDRSRINSDEEDGHELDEVKRPKPLNIEGNDVGEDVDELSMPTPKASQRLANAPSPNRNEPAVALSSLSKASHARSHSSTSPPRFYVSQANETFVRTSQMEPSPAMKLPNFRSSTMGRSSGRPLQESSRIERTSSLTLPGKKPKIQAASDSDLMLESMRTDNSR